MLTKDTTYFVVVSGSAAFDLGLVASDGEDSGSAAGWSIADRARAVQSGAWAEHSTDDNLAVSVRGEEFVSNDATLSALGLSAGTLAPPFAAGTTTYTADVVNSVAGVTVTATKNHADATAPVIKLGGVVDADGTVALAEGDNVITVEVTAEDGVTTETYTVHRDAGGDGGFHGHGGLLHHRGDRDHNIRQEGHGQLDRRGDLRDDEQL